MSLPPGSPLARLFDAPMRPGRLAWIGLRPARREPMLEVAEAMLAPGRGIEGDRWRGAETGARQVTLIAAEHLRAIAGYLGLERVEAAIEGAGVGHEAVACAVGQALAHGGHGGRARDRPVPGQRPDAASKLLHERPLGALIHPRQCHVLDFLNLVSDR